MHDTALFILNVKKKPEMYLGGTATLLEVWYYFSGYNMCNELRHHEPNEESPFYLFQDWLKEEAGLSPNVTVIEYIKQKTASEQEAINMFFELFEGYMNTTESQGSNNENTE